MSIGKKVSTCYIAINKIKRNPNKYVCSDMLIKDLQFRIYKYSNWDVSFGD